LLGFVHISDCIADLASCGESKKKTNKQTNKKKKAKNKKKKKTFPKTGWENRENVFHTS